MEATSTTSSGIAELLVIKDQLIGAIDQLVASGIELPSINEPNPSLAPPHPAVGMACAYAEQLQAVLQGPLRSIEKSLAFHVPACLRVALEAHVSETLREAAEKGKPALHVDEIAKSSNINPRKLARVLRLLAAHHIFREVKPDVFTRNRCSTSLDTGKSVADLTVADALFKGASYLTESLLDPATSPSEASVDCGVARAYGIKNPMFEFWGEPEHDGTRRKFANAMRGFSALFGGDAGLLEGYPWAALKEGATVVDVGSGVGAVSLPVAKSVPHIKLILQDRKEVVEKEALDLWNAEAPQELESGRVKLMQHDFFTEQPVKGADVYMMRGTIHNWDDPNALKILKRLAEAASASSRFLLIEQALTHLAPPQPFPPPTTLPYIMDLQMLVACPGMERTTEQYEELGAKAGWKLRKIWRTGPEGNDVGWRHYEFELAEK
ncbi:hypothetical protein JCM1840_005474 [Sporobolomyces johnsonii]